LNAEDLRSRNNIFEQSAVAKHFFEKIDFAKMKNTDELITLGNNYCFSDTKNTFVVYLKEGGSTQLDFREMEGVFDVSWYNPRIGGELQTSEIKSVSGGEWVDLGFAPEEKNEDWVILIKRKN